MTSLRPTGDPAGTDPARQADDDGLSDRHDTDLGGTTSGVRDSRPGVMLAVVLLAVFVVVLIAAVVLGVIA